jgi:hypothetical protein
MDPALEGVSEVEAVVASAQDTVGASDQDTAPVLEAGFTTLVEESALHARFMRLILSTPRKRGKQSFRAQWCSG